MNREKLDKSGLKAIAMPFIMLLLQGILFFISAGRLNVANAWIYFSIAVIITVFNAIYMVRYIPGLVNQRGEHRDGTKTWDLILLFPFFTIPVFLFPVVAGLDVGRYKWTGMNHAILVLAVFLYIFADFINLWAMKVNRHFEGTVRIQEDRDHKVISSGPYRFIRHPGYLSMAIALIAPSLILGSVWSLIPAALTIIILIIRTKLEDDFLKKELNGYLEYANKVKYRLLPGIW